MGQGLGLLHLQPQDLEPLGQKPGLTLAKLSPVCAEPTVWQLTALVNGQ